MNPQIVSANEVEAHDVAEWGHVGIQGTFRPIADTLGVTAFGLNELELAPNAAGPVHDHRQDAQEEVYVIVRGDGKIRVEGAEHELRPGQYVFVPADATRQMVAGPNGLVWVGIGCQPRSYQPPEPPVGGPASHSATRTRCDPSPSAETST